MTRDVGRSVAGTLEVVDVVALGDTGPYAVAFGPAGDMWVTLVETGELLRRSPDGSERRFAIGARPGQLAVARDAVWCAVTGEDRIAVVAGDEISFVDAPGGPYGMAVAGDGVWTGLMQGDALARLGSRGPRLDVPLPVDGAFPAMIAVDEDDAVWVSLNQAGALARRSPAGDLDLVRLPVGAAPVGIATAAGQVWAADIAGGRILLVDPIRHVREFTLDPESRPHAVIADEDGCWFTEWGANRLGRITLDGQVTEFDLSGGGEEPHGLARDRHGDVWVAFESGAVAGYRPSTTERSGAS